MKIVQIQDKHIINKKNLPKWQQKLYDGNGRHTYIMYETTNKSGKQQHKLLATSHYYDPDKVTKIRKKNAILMKFADLPEPTTVTNVRYQKDLRGRQFSPNYPDMQVVGKVSPYQEKRIKRFLKNSSNKTNKKNSKRPRR